MDETSARSSPRLTIGRYEVLAEIARGGMGTVYLGQSLGAGGFARLVAIKVVTDLTDEDAVLSLLDEARIAGYVRHPHAVSILDVGLDEIGPFVVMDYVDGLPLSRAQVGLAPAARRALGMRVVLDVLGALDAAHRATDLARRPLFVVHRDVSPQNVLVGTDGLARLTDFGIASARARAGHTAPDIVKGKPRYLAPEQVRGAPCDGRTDVYAVSAMLFEVLTGRPFRPAEPPAAMLLRAAAGEVPSIDPHAEGLPRDVVDVMLWGLAPRRDDRPASARAFAELLEPVAARGGLLASHDEVATIMRQRFLTHFSRRAITIARQLAHRGAARRPLCRGARVPMLVEPAAPGAW